MDALQGALKDAGFTVNSNVEIRSDTQTQETRAPGDAIQVKVDVDVNELAVILLEGEGGVFAWQQPDPDSSPQTRDGGKVTRTFTLTPRDSEGVAPMRRGPLIDWAVDKLIKPVRVMVLKFFAQKTVDAIVSRIESSNPAGLVLLSGMDPAAWVPHGDKLPVTGKQGTLQVLLLVHGTFSSTSGSFGALGSFTDGIEFLTEAYDKYDAVIGFDHKTLVEDVETNAKALALALSALPKGTIVDSIAFSRGGLVWRVLAQELFAKNPDIIFRNTVFVGCTNAGTHLAEPENWDDLIDFYTNVVMAGARAVGAITGSALVSPLVNLAIKTLGEFMQMLAQVAISERKVPGLASMEPDGETVKRLNKAGNPLVRLNTYRAITANFEPGRFDISKGVTEALAGFLADRLTDRLWQNDANDLVVDTASMTTFGKGATLPATSVFAYADKDVIYHTIYFAQTQTCDKLSDWLSLPHGLKRMVKDAALVSYSDRYSAEIPMLADAVEVMAEELPRRRGDLPPTFAPPPLGYVVEVSQPQPQPDSQELIPCHINASLPESPVFGETTELEVTLSLEEIVQVTGKTHVNDIAAFKSGLPLHVKVRARTNCAVDGPAVEEVPPPRKGSPQVLSFGLRGLAVGPAEVWVDVLQGARRLSRLILQPLFVAKGNLDASAVVDSDREDPPLVDLRIIEEGSPDRWRLRFIARCDELEINHEFVTQDFTGNKEAYIGSLYKKLESCWSTAGIAFEQLMQGVRADGVQMFVDLFPIDLRRLIWRHRTAIGSLQVIASEPSIPWEIVHVVDPDKATPLSGGGVFLAELGLMRWMSNVGIAPARLRLRHGKTGYCIPRYHDARLNLASVAQEAKMLGDLLGAVSIGDEIAPVLSALARDKGEDFDALHFACHGSTDYTQVWNAGLLLNVAGSDKTSLLSVASVQTYANLSVDGQRPLIFLNACQSGVSGRTLSGAGGLAQAFVQRGAGLFVGTLWSIGDRPALGFASQFYGQLKAGECVSQALRAAREQAKKDLDTSWLAYTVYGHPYARLSP
ncbi:CHAT domain-containing protein [Pseudomonas kribbensis]|uniref:CHAT domain-containing protein n=1 Tax=Pseudomonas kribbensis TaxID=1628086 RepID=UPI003BF892A7